MVLFDDVDGKAIFGMVGAFGRAAQVLVVDLNSLQNPTHCFHLSRARARSRRSSPHLACTGPLNDNDVMEACSTLT
jgi:hypothetical protein